MTEVEKLFDFLSSRGLLIGGITLGDNPVDAETVAKEIRESLEEIERGEAEDIIEI